MSSTGVAIGMTGTGIVLAYLLSPIFTIISIFPSVADMELETAPEIKEALKREIDTTVLGYANPIFLFPMNI